MSDRQSHPAAIARLRRRAKDVLNLLRGHDAEAAAWLAGLHPAFGGLAPETVCAGSPRLADVQLAVARECGFGSWPQLRAHVGLSPTPDLAPLCPVEADLIADPTYRSELAASKGLAPVGTAAVSRHGVGYIVEDHVLAATTANLARCAGKRPDFRLDDLLPRIRFVNLPARLANLLREVDTCTGKELVFLDTVPSLHPQTAIPGRHQVLNTQDPRCILFHLDAQDLHETVLAHELGHIWLELVEGIEDFRVPRSLADLPRVTQLHLVQSFVLDIRVNALLAQRGFDLSVIDDAEQDALRTLAQQCALGKRIRAPRAAAALALTVASCLMDQGRWPAPQQRDAQACLAMVREALPDLYCVAESHVASVARHGVADQAGIRRVVDECAAASFRLAGDVFDAERDLVDAPPSEWFVDKHPGFLPGVPLHAKLDIWRVMARRGLGPKVRYSVIRNNPHLAEIVLVGAGSGEPCPPSVTYSLPLSPPMAPPATPPLHLAAPGASAPNWPPTAGVSLAPEGWPAPVPWDPSGRLADGRGYMPGMGRWLSRVAFEEQELGEHPYGYGRNSPAQYGDPSGLSVAGLVLLGWALVAAGWLVARSLAYNLGYTMPDNRLTRFLDWLAFPITYAWTGSEAAVCPDADDVGKLVKGLEDSTQTRFVLDCDVPDWAETDCAQRCHGLATFVRGQGRYPASSTDSAICRDIMTKVK